MKLILLGAPGAGKGTQAEILCDKLAIPTISTGNILRAAVKDGTPMGQKAKSFMDAGALVPDDVIVGIVKEPLAQPDCVNGFILDGMPRTIAQGEALEKMGVEIDKVVNLIVPDEAITKRMSGRRVCAKCGASYHIINKPSAKEGVCDRCGGELAIRKDDEPATVLDKSRMLLNLRKCGKPVRSARLHSRLAARRSSRVLPRQRSTKSSMTLSCATVQDPTSCTCTAFRPRRASA